MTTMDELHERYTSLEAQVEIKPEASIDASCLLTFEYEYPDQDTEIVIETDEFTAVCPWTGLPDYGTLTIRYTPNHSCIELKSLKYYLLTYIGVGIVQEHAANRILQDLVTSCTPIRMTAGLDYKVRGGLQTTVTVHHEI